MSSDYDIQALNGAAEFFERLATGSDPAPLAFAQAIRSVMAQATQMREALENIAVRHVPDQPPAFGGSETDWAIRQHSQLRAIAHSALTPTGGRMDE